MSNSGHFTGLVSEKTRLSKVNLHDAAEVLMAAEPGLTKEQALHHLLYSPAGRAMLRMMQGHSATAPQAAREEPVLHDQSAHIQEVHKIAKQIVEGTASMSEAQFTKLVKVQAQVDRLADETPEQAFAKYFTAPTEEGRLVREAHRIARRAAA